jgi:hypothetical protein
VTPEMIAPVIAPTAAYVAKRRIRFLTSAHLRKSSLLL